MDELGGVREKSVKMHMEACKYCFFFQAEDGIRDTSVTGVQTCALPICDRLITLDHAYTHFKVTLHVYHCRHLNGEPQPLACDEIRWVTIAELEQYPFPAANGKIIEALKVLDHG